MEIYANREFLNICGYTLPNVKGLECIHKGRFRNIHHQALSVRLPDFVLSCQSHFIIYT